MLLRSLCALVSAFAILGLSPDAAAECMAAPELTPASAEPVQGAAAAVAEDRDGRVVAPVMLNGQGPFRFIIDTGANRSAISERVARRLALPVVGQGDVHTVHDVSPAPLVRVESLNFGGVSVNQEAMPLLRGPVLAGEDGLLGVDSMQGRRLIMDFENECVEIEPSRRARRLANWTSVRGTLRFGHLVLIEGSIRSRRVNILIDTGSAVTLANPILRDRLRATVRQDIPSDELVRAFTAGSPIVFDTAVIIPSVNLGDVQARTVLAFVGDFHIFDLWGLRDEPTLLVGMDVLKQARGVAIDYQTGVVYFQLPPERRTGSRVAGRTSSATTSIVR